MHDEDALFSFRQIEKDFSFIEVLIEETRTIKELIKWGKEGKGFEEEEIKALQK